MRTLGLFYQALGKGGIERGASFQIPMFVSLGWNVVVFTNAPARDTDYENAADYRHVCLGAFDGDVAARRARVAAALRDNGVDLIIHHDAYVPDSLKADLEGARAAGVKAIVFWHSVFTHFLLRRGRQLETRALWKASTLADAMITLTKTDETFFRLYGIPALAIPYSDSDLMKGFVRPSWPRRMLWMGRFVELKRPMDALRIAERILPAHPDAELVLLGDGECEPEMRAWVAKHPEMVKAVRFEGFRNDVRPCLEQAGVGLVTSRFEGYCHSIVEMKMAALPIVSYDMPWLDTVRPGSGVVSVPQGDVTAAADAVCRLFADERERRRLGGLSRQSFAEITSTDQAAAYDGLFGQVLSGEVSSCRLPDPSRVPVVMETLSAHVEEALRLATETRDEVWQRDRSYRLGRAISWPYRAVKRILVRR